jgi:hypothetical protein
MSSEVMPLGGMTTLDLMQLRASLDAQAAPLRAQLKSLDATMELVDSALWEKLPEVNGEAQPISHAFPDGTVVSVKQKTTQRYIPAEGQSDQFWQWVRDGNRWEFTGRTLIQAAVEKWAAEHTNPFTGAASLPPHVTTMQTKSVVVKVQKVGP